MIVRGMIVQEGNVCIFDSKNGQSIPVCICKESVTSYYESVLSGTIHRADVPDCLLALGLLRSVPGEPGVLVPIPPETATAALVKPVEQSILESRQIIEEIRSALSAFTSVYLQARRQEDIPISLLIGRTAISNALEHAVNACENELITVQPGSGRSPEYLSEALERDLEILAKGVRQRSIYQHSIRMHQPTLEYIERVTAAGAQVRTTPEVVDRVIICDDKVAFIPTGERRESEALELRHPALIRFLRANFERQWESAHTVHPANLQASREHVLDDTQRSIARMLVSGHTDDSIARRLGLSRRTVATRVGEISQRLGSSSRAQLGYLIASRGLLPAEGPDLGGIC